MNYDVGRVDRDAWLLTDSAQVCTLIKFIDATARAGITVTIRSSGRMATFAIRLRDFHRPTSAETCIVPVVLKLSDIGSYVT